MADSDDPITERPFMPGYGIATGPEGLLPWTWAEQHLRDSRHYWVATRGTDGAPHLAAVWAVWLDGALYFSTGGRSRKARNLAADPRCSVTPADPVEAVVLNGVAVRVTGDRTRITEVYVEKYGSGFPEPDENPVFAVRPATAIGVIDTEDQFSTAATRWRFR
jgi:general stress protein 26